MLRVRNFIPAVSVEGDRASTDARRGEGVYDRAVQAMAFMKGRKIPFGVSCCYTSANFDQVSSGAFIDQLGEWGAMFVWYFHYMPVGSDADVGLMVSPEQREMIERTGAHSTNLEGAETAEELCARCERYAEHWAPAAARLWAENPHVVDFVR